MEHKGMKKGGKMESGYKITVGPPMRDMQQDNGDTDEVAAEAQIDAESERLRRAKCNK